jgi:hypothetical protein
MARIFADSFYVNGVPLDQSWWRAIDTAQFQSWNGDLGTSHNPTVPLTVAGAGMWFTGAVTFSGTYPFGCPFGATTPLILGANDWIKTPPKSRLPLQGLGAAYDCSYVAPITAAVFDSQGQTTSPPSRPSLARFRFMGSLDAVTNIDPGGAGAAQGTFPPYYTGGRIQCPLRVHHNATLQTVIFNFKIGQSHGGGLPASQPSFRVIKVDTFGNVTPLLTNATNGWLPLGATTTGTYYNSGNLQTFTYTCDAGVVIDITKFTFWAQVTDESDSPDTNSTLGNARSGNQYVSVGCSFTNITDFRPA